MSKFIDERIVQMGFDNKNFETNVKQSVSTLDKLKSTLDFSGTASSMNRNLDSVDTSVLMNSLNKVSGGFSVLEVAAITAISNITNRIIDMGIQMVKSLSTDNISAGWEKFGEKTTSVATLFAQFGDMDLVNTQLEKLNWFTDETSYNFTDMVSNISKFTASGQGLEDSVTAMMGIANWAALSGQNATTASRAMYQLSQAMSSGTIKLADWKSIQNANMDTKEFRKKVLDQAVKDRELIESANGEYITKAGNAFNINQFTEHLTSDGWFTADVLMKTLGKYSAAVDQVYDKVQQDENISTTSDAIAKYGEELDEFGLKAFLAAQEAKTFRDVIDSVKDATASAWMNTFENIFGGYDESKVFWTDLANELYDVFVEKLNFRNEILGLWGDLGGRSDLFANTEEETGAFWNLYYAIIEIKNLISRSWNIIFPFSQMEDEADQITDIAGKLKSLTERLKEWTEGLYLSDEASETFSNILQGIFSILKFVIKSITALYKGIKPLIGVIKQLVSGLLYLAGALGSIITRFVATTSIFDKTSSAIYNGLTKIIDGVKELRIIDKMSSALKNLSNIFKISGGTTSNYAKILEGLKAIIQIIGRVILSLYSIIAKYLFPILIKLTGILGGALGKIGGTLVRVLAYISDAIVKFNELTKAGTTVGGVFSFIGEGLKNLFSTIVNTFKQFGKVDSSGVDSFTEDVDKKFGPLSILIEGITKLFEGLWSVLKAVVPVIGQAFGYIGTVLGQLGTKISEAFSGKGSLFTISTLLDVAFWSAIAISIYQLVDVFFDLQEALGGIFDGFADVLDSKAMLQYAEALKTLSIGILILVAALILLATIDSDKLTTSLVTLGLLLAMMGGLMKVMQSMFSVTDKLGISALLNAKSMQMAATAMMTMAFSVGLMALSVKALASLDEKQMITGIMGITMLLGILLGASAIISKNQKMFAKGAAGLIKMALAVWLLSIPVKKLGKMKPDELKQGLLGVSALVGMVTLVITVSGLIGKANKVSKGLITFAVALTILTVPLKIIGKMKTKNLIQGLLGVTALAGLMVGIGVLGKYMKNSLFASLAMVNIANALLIASIPLRIIGGMGWKKLLIGMTGILAISTIMAGLGALSKYMKNSLIVSMAMAVMGTSLIAFAIAMKIIGSMKWSSITKAGVAMLGLITILAVISKIMGIKGALTMVIMSVGILTLASSLIVFSAAMMTLALIKWSTMLKALAIFTVAILGLSIISKVLAPSIPLILAFSIAIAIFGAGLLLIATAIVLVTTSLGIFGSMFIVTLMKVLEGVIMLSPLIMKALGELINAALQALLIAFPSFIELISAIWEGLIQMLADRGPGLITVMVSLVTTLLATLAEHFPTIVGSIMSMLFDLLLAIKDNAFAVVDIVIDVILEMLKAIKERVPEIVGVVLDVAISLVESLVQKLIELIPRLVTAAIDLLIGFINGFGKAVEDNAGKIREAMINFGKSMWNAFKSFWGINSPSTKMVEIAKWLWEGLKNGLKNGLTAVLNVIKNVAQAVITGFKNIFNGAKDLGKNVIDGIANGIKGGISAVTSIVKNAASSVVTGFKNAFNGAKDLGKSVIDGVSGGIKSGLTTVSNAAKNVAQGATKAIKTAFSGAKDLGINVVDGISDGIKGGLTKVGDAAKNIGNSLLGGIKGILGIKSPSRAFAEIGKFVDLGLAKGMDDNSKIVSNSADELGQDVIDGVTNSGITGAIQKMYNSLNGDFDNSIVIRPVMDLSEIQNGTNQIYGMMSEVDDYSLSGSSDIASRTHRSISSAESTNNKINKEVVNPIGQKPTTEVTNNTFNIKGNDPKKIAEEVSTLLQRQVDRRNQKWVP